MYFLAKHATTDTVMQFQEIDRPTPDTLLARRVDTRAPVIFLPKSGLSLRPAGWAIVVRDTSKFKTDHIAAVAAYRSGCKGCM